MCSNAKPNRRRVTFDSQSVSIRANAVVAKTKRCSSTQFVTHVKNGPKCRVLFYSQEITDYHEELDAHREIVKIIDEQIILHESYQKEAPPQNRAM